MIPSAKVVFLIDISTDKENPDTLVQWAHSVCLSCLRILLFLSARAGTTTKSKKSQTSVKWGYKFYSSKSIKTKIEFHKFFDFKLKYFEEFENEVQKRLDTTRKITSTVKPAVSLSKALTELLSDFPWEGPDISSPVKGRRNYKQTTTSNSLIYLFTNCPRNPVQLKKFSGKQVPDADVFLDSFLPPSLHHELCYTSKLSLNWIDTAGLLAQQNDEDAELLSVNIVETAVQKAGGHVFPLDGIVQNGSPYHIDVQSLLVDGTDHEREETLQNDRTKAIYNQSHILSISTTLEHLQSRTDDVMLPGVDTVLKVGSVQICLDLLPSTKQWDNRFSEPLEDEISMTTVSESGGDTCIYKDHIPSSLKAYSILEQTSGCQMLLPDHCYIGSEGDHKKHPSSDRGTFRKLLSYLATRSCKLVLLCENTGQLSVLEPLTIDTGCIYLLSKTCTLSMEKVLIQQNGQQVHDIEESGNSGEKSCDILVDKLLAGKKYRPQNVIMESTVQEAGIMDGKLMDKWHIPGQRSSFRNLIQKLNLRINDLEFLTKDETDMLKQLQKAYKLEKKPPGVRDTPTTTTAVTEEKKVTDKFDLPLKGKKSRTSISRAEMILSKSKEVVKDRDSTVKDNGEKIKDKLDKDKPEVTALMADFKSVDELKEFLTSTYERVISGETTCVDVNVQTSVTVTLHYLKQAGIDSPEEECEKVLNDSLVLSASSLREKYTNTPDVSLEQKIAEYQFQIVIRLEMLSTLINKDQTMGEEDCNDEVVGMLRTLSFMCEAGALSKFMETCLLYNYMHTIPKTLANIYDELMQPLPDALSNILSPNNSSVDQSVFDSSLISNDGGPPSTRTRSHGSVGPPSIQPGSNKPFNVDTSINRSRGSKKLVHHPSLADFGAKRQIVVEKVLPKKEKSSRKKSRTRKQEKEKVAKSLFDKSRGTKLERRQSVAVMQTSQKTPKKSQARLLFKSPVSNSTRRESLVAETPQHKQSVRLHGDISDTSMETDVVEESPEKACHYDRKDTPTKGKRAKALMRRSFYSAGPIKRTKNLTQYFQLADRIAGRQPPPTDQTQKKLPKLLSLESENTFKSPEKNSSFLLSQLVFSPSPAKRTPKKLNQTPSKLLMNSPSQNTRSRHQSGSTLGLFGSPNQKGFLQQNMSSPSLHSLQSPRSRRQSPRILVEESATKSEVTTPNKTPEKSPVCGTITSGLDSPSQNTRLKVSATPTRRSVRAALFSKSPAPNRTCSPRIANASPRVLLSRFGSPRKQTVSDNLSSPRRHLQGFSDQVFTTQVKSNVTNHFEEIGNHSSVTVQNKNQHSESATKSQSQSIQKTPSPHSKKVKTPDSFDKWHRRKHSNQVSPAPSKSLCSPMVSVRSEISSPNKFKVHQNIEVQSPLRKKRNLILSPDRPLESPSKRRRTSRLDSLTTLGKGSVLNSTMIRDGSQGFDVNSPLQSSQTSVASSLDYYSTVNDEVFLLQDKLQGESLSQVEDMEVDGVENLRLLRVRSIDKGKTLIKNRTLERICSSDFPCSGGSERSESPIFFNSARNRHFSGEKYIRNMENIKVDSNCSPVNSAGSSPTFGKSPSDKKYSPNVSAKSLMHLMNSPFVNISEKKETRSRRSLKLPN